MLRRIILFLFSPLIFIIGLGICGYIIFDGTLFTTEYNENIHFRPIRIILFALIIIIASLATSLFGTISCVRDGNLDDITSIFKDIASM